MSIVGAGQFGTVFRATAHDGAVCAVKTGAAASEADMCRKLGSIVANPRPFLEFFSSGLGLVAMELGGEALQRCPDTPQRLQLLRALRFMRAQDKIGFISRLGEILAGDSP